MKNCVVLAVYEGGWSYIISVPVSEAEDRPDAGPVIGTARVVLATLDNPVHDIVVAKARLTDLDINTVLLSGQNVRMERHFARNSRTSLIRANLEGRLRETQIVLGKVGQQILGNPMGIALVGLRLVAIAIEPIAPEVSKVLSDRS